MCRILSWASAESRCEFAGAKERTVSRVAGALESRCGQPNEGDARREFGMKKINPRFLSSQACAKPLRAICLAQVLAQKQQSEHFLDPYRA